ncbi:MAG TPA: hypothetical protein VIK18_00895 [Pirellulales bacterium]
MYTQKIERRFWLAPPRTPDTRFAIVGNPRTGSSHLASLLDSHPDIACWDDEPFLAGEAFDRSEYATPAAFLRGLVFNVNAQAVGFKLLWDAMVRLSDPWQLFRDLDVALVHVWRRNRLDALISLDLAKLNGAFTSHYGSYDTAVVELDYSHCQRWFTWSEQRDNLIRAGAREHSIRRLEIEYKELCRGQTAVLDFLGVPRCPLASRLRKQRSGGQSQSVSNYLDLKRRFAGSRWAEFFED